MLGWIIRAVIIVIITLAIGGVMAIFRQPNWIVAFILATIFVYYFEVFGQISLPDLS